MNKITTGTISRSLIIAWAALLVFILGILTWISIAPGGRVIVSDDISTAVDLQLPDAMPVEDYVLKDEEKNEDTGGSAALSPSHNPIQLAQESTHLNNPYHLYAGQPITHTTGKIKVAFIFSNLGRNDALLDKILEKTPAGVTMAYLPNSSALKTKISTAREKGHEVLINIPMESNDYTHTDMDPHTLFTGLPPQQNIQRLHWAMAQGHEYVGLINLAGSLFLSSRKDLAPVLQEMRKHGLLFMESDECFGSQAEESSKSIQLPHIKSHFVLNESLTPAELHANLIRAEQMAQESGLIIIVAHASPLNTPILLTWIRNAQEQNYAFLPLSQAAGLSRPHQETSL
jgi:polysaccharide deacetylase 2 family uncharacterized protein YibQ